MPADLAIQVQQHVQNMSQPHPAWIITAADGFHQPITNPL
jgi:hypothetical protein